MRGCVLLLAIAACANQYHVRLDPPRPGITPQERVELFWKRRPTAQWQATSEGTLVNQTLVLGDKQPGVEEVEVVSPEDLEPLVGPDSETMQHARRSIVERGKARRWYYVAGAALVGGFVLAVALSDDEPTFGPSKSWIGVGVALGGLLIGYPISRHHTRQELIWRKRAFGTYTRDLGTRLNVCAQGTRVVPCEGPTPTAPAPETTLPPGR